MLGTDNEEQPDSYVIFDMVFCVLKLQHKLLNFLFQVICVTDQMQEFMKPFWRALNLTKDKT